MKMVNATFAYEGCKLLGKCGIYYLYPRLTPQFLQICDLLAKRKLVQIRVFVQWNVRKIPPFCEAISSEQVTFKLGTFTDFKAFSPAF